MATFLSTHFTLEELIQSQTAARNGIDNTPSPAIIANLKILCQGLEQVRALLGQPMNISSGYRCSALNKAVGGAANSDHVNGLAADFICPQFGSPADIAKAIQASSIVFDQVIYEYTWCHLGFGTGLRKMALTLNKGGGYLPGIVTV